MASLKVILIANACQWVSWADKIAAIKAFYAPLVELQIDIKYTDFQDIPLGSYPGSVTVFGPNGTTDVPGTDLEIDQTWFNDNIGPLITGYDIAVFQAANVAATGLPLGIKFEELNGTWCAETFVPAEDNVYVLPPLPGASIGVNLGNEAIIDIEHEISHALYSIAGQTDNTHLYFYANNFARVLTDIKLPNQSALISLYQNVIADLQSELGIIKQQQSTADMEPSQTAQAPAGATQTPTTTEPSFPAKIVSWANIIAQEEGAVAELNNPGNLGYASLTQSWGAIQGPAKGDGGYLAQFPTYEAGYTALCNFLVLGCEDQLADFHNARTLAAFTNVYADNPPTGYLDVIVEAMGGDPNVQISTFLN
jgi:hypothetical protein